MNTKLLPCPFCCGSDLTVQKDFSEDDPTQWISMHVFCRGCYARGRNHYRIGWCESEQAAVEAWNDRSGPSTATEADILAIRKVLRNVVKWHAVRTRGTDEIAPAEFQQPEIAEAMAILRVSP